MPVNAHGRSSLDGNLRPTKQESLQLHVHHKDARLRSEGSTLGWHPMYLLPQNMRSTGHFNPALNNSQLWHAKVAHASSDSRPLWNQILVHLPELANVKNSASGNINFCSQNIDPVKRTTVQIVFTVEPSGTPPPLMTMSWATQ